MIIPAFPTSKIKEVSLHKNYNLKNITYNTNIKVFLHQKRNMVVHDEEKMDSLNNIYFRNEKKIFEIVYIEIIFYSFLS